jgi:uncharacterized protein (TIGR00251 family)
LPEDDSKYLNLKVIPNASCSEITGWKDGVLQVRIAAPPVKGKANKELVAILSRMLGVSKSAITIIKGQASRNKVINIEGLSNEEISERLTT